MNPPPPSRSLSFLLSCSLALSCAVVLPFPNPLAVALHVRGPLTPIFLLHSAQELHTHNRSAAREHLHPASTHPPAHPHTSSDALHGSYEATQGGVVDLDGLHLVLQHFVALVNLSCVRPRDVHQSPSNCAHPHELFSCTQAHTCTRTCQHPPTATRPRAHTSPHAHIHIHARAPQLANACAQIHATSWSHARIVYSS
jgi:hypothetical protein